MESVFSSLLPFISYFFIFFFKLTLASHCLLRGVPVCLQHLTIWQAEGQSFPHRQQALDLPYIT